MTASSRRRNWRRSFPRSFCAGFDFKTLNRASIPTIEYAGKRSEAAILNEASAFGAGSPLQIVRFFRGGKFQKDAQQLELIKETGPTWETGWKNMIVQGDNLQFFKTCFLDQDPLIRGRVKGKVKVVVMDPPFATKSDFAASEGEDSYSDQVDRGEFIESIRERLVFVSELLSNDGSVYVHLDLRMVHQVKTDKLCCFTPLVFGQRRIPDSQCPDRAALRTGQASRPQENLPRASRYRLVAFPPSFPLTRPFFLK